MKTYARIAITALIATLVVLVSAGTATATTNYKVPTTGPGQIDDFWTPIPHPGLVGEITVDCESAPEGVGMVVYEWGNNSGDYHPLSIHHFEPDGVVQHQTVVGPHQAGQFSHFWTENHTFQAYIMSGDTVVASIDTTIDCTHVPPTVTLDTECPHFGFTLHNNDAEWAYFAATIDGMLIGALPVVAPNSSMPYIVAGVEDTPVHVVIEGARSGEPLVVLFDEVLTMDCLGDPVQWPPSEKPDTDEREDHNREDDRKPAKPVRAVGGLSAG